MLQKSGRLVLWEAMFILELHSAETQAFHHSSLQIYEAFPPADETLSDSIFPQNTLFHFHKLYFPSIVKVPVIPHIKKTTSTIQNK